MKRRDLDHLLVVGLLSAGCSDAPIETVYDAYEGDAFPTTPMPVAYPSSGAVVVADTLSDQLSFVDRSTGALFASSPVGRNPVSIDGPSNMLVNPALDALFTVYTYPVAPDGVLGPHGDLSQLTPRFGYVHAFAIEDLTLLGELRVEAAPGDMVMSADGNRIVVSHHDLLKVAKAQGNEIAARADLAVFDPADLTAGDAPGATRIMTCAAPNGIALTAPAGDTAFVACYAEDRIAVVNVSDPSADVVLVDVGPSPGALGEPVYGPMTAQLSPDGSTLAVGCTDSLEVRLFSVSGTTLTAAGSVSVAGAPGVGAWSSDGTQLVVPTRGSDGIDVIDVGAGSIVSSNALAPSDCLNPVELTRDDDMLWAVCQGDGVDVGRLLRVDLSTLQPSVSADVGLGPSSLVLLDGGGG